MWCCALLALLLAQAALMAVVVAAGKSLAGWSGDHFLILQHDGLVYGQGKNSFGQLGLGTKTSAVTFPTAMKNMKRATDITAGSQHSCVVEFGGKAFCVGTDKYGESGADGDRTSKSTLVAVKTPASAGPVAQLFAGPGSTCALTTANTAYCWGYNTGNLGDNTMINRDTPVPVKGFASVNSCTGIAVGGTHTCFLNSVGKAYCTGFNLYGMLGTGGKDTLVPVAVSSSQTFTSIAAGALHTCASNADSVYCWGFGAYGQLGYGNQDNYKTPVKVKGLTSAANQPVSVWASSFATYVLTASGGVVAFGENANGALGNGNTKFQMSPVTFKKPSSSSSILEVRGGGPSTCVLLENSPEVWCVGSNEDGQLGQASTKLGRSTVLVKTQRLPKVTATFGPTRPPVMGTPAPTMKPGTVAPTKKPTTAYPTKKVTKAPTRKGQTYRPTFKPSTAPTPTPTQLPTQPTKRPTNAPTTKPTLPTKSPTSWPTSRPTKAPTSAPTKRPSNWPTSWPTKAPTSWPTQKPTKTPTSKPTQI